MGSDGRCARWRELERWVAVDTPEDLETIAALEMHEEGQLTLNALRRHRKRANRLAAGRLQEMSVTASAPVERGAFEDIETLSEELGHSSGEEIQAASIAALPMEDGSPQPCPKCRKPVRVKARNRVRHLLTAAGELRISRNYHHCTRCKSGRE